MQYKLYPVCKELRPWVRYFWSYDAKLGENITLHVKSFSDRYPRLIYQDIDSYAPIFEQQSSENKPMCYISGIDTKPTDAFWRGSFSHFGVSFHPHALPVFFGIDASALTDITPNLLLLDKTDLPEKLRDSRSHKERVKHTTLYLCDKLKLHNLDAVMSDMFNNTTFKTADSKALQQATKYYKLSERQLQRRFKASVGISAKKHERILRFETALETLERTNYGKLTNIAYELGYADQSHFIKDFIAFSGMTPYDFIQQKNLGSESASFIYPSDKED